MPLSAWMRSHMEVVLEETCRTLPHGGDHESRKLVANRLQDAAEAGQCSLPELRAVAFQAFSDLIKRH
jgi:hypothetical protein